eukprot:TRINITY_DN15484_c0_g1_i1.p1 TRINITY_DN15484_c0_g1~~TRINITY_DN15484_c0_g1_i1.p1  ORF type:complete len:528 (+),score=61.55 TRINITY_DN15484_c0_g1_i1:98-1585(+)
MAPLIESDTESSVDAPSESALSNATTALSSSNIPQTVACKAAPEASDVTRAVVKPTFDDPSVLSSLQGEWHASRFGRLKVVGHDVMYSQMADASIQPTLTLNVDADGTVYLDGWRTDLSELGISGYIRWTRSDRARNDDVIVWARPLSPLASSFAAETQKCLPANTEDVSAIQGPWDTSHFGRVHVDGALVSYRLAGPGAPRLHLCVFPGGQLALDGWRAEAEMSSGGCLKWTHCNDVEGKTPVVWIRPRRYKSSLGRCCMSPGGGASSSKTRQRKPPSRLVALAEVACDGKRSTQRKPTRRTSNTNDNEVARSSRQCLEDKKIKMPFPQSPLKTRQPMSQQTCSGGARKRVRRGEDRAEALIDSNLPCQRNPAMLTGTSASGVTSPPELVATSTPARTTETDVPAIMPDAVPLSKEEKCALQRMMDSLNDAELDRVLMFLEPELGMSSDDEIQLDIDLLAPGRQHALVEFVQLEVGHTLASASSTVFTGAIEAR